MSRLSEEISRAMHCTIPSKVCAAAEDIAALHAPHVLAVLFYGSCFRSGKINDRVLDFYVLVDGYASTYGRGLRALANRLLPPNVFYRETQVGDDILRSKYAVISLADFERRCREDWFNASIWARFSQPVAFALPADEQVGQRVIDAVTNAVCAMVVNSIPLAPETNARSLWTTALGLTYAAELRSEGETKPAELYSQDRGHFDKLTPLALEEVSARGGPLITSPRAARRKWWWRRLQGRLISLLRLAKGAFTFDGGIDYLAWKIRRHSGVVIEIKPWQRRHPIVAGLLLYLRLRRQGAFR